MEEEKRFKVGEIKYFRCVCVLTRLGFVGGPSGYEEVGEEQKGDHGPLILKRTEEPREINR